MKKNSKEWLEREQVLKREALELSLRSEMLKDLSDKVWRQIKAFHDEYPDEVLDTLPWDEKELVISKTEELEKKLEAAATWLRRIEKEYDAVRVKVNKFYGEEVMQKQTPLPDYPSIEPDSADWWKKE